MPDFRQLKDVVETWAIQRHGVREFTRADLDRWCQAMNDRTRHVIHLYQKRDPEFYQALALVANDIAEARARNEVLQTPIHQDLIRDMGVTEEAYYSALSELCVNASTMLTKRARIIADGKDVTNL